MTVAIEKEVPDIEIFHFIENHSYCCCRGGRVQRDNTQREHTHDEQFGYQHHTRRCFSHAGCDRKDAAAGYNAVAEYSAAYFDNA